ncbi:hypothetical protein PM082_021929 [Marasmius tenuissimus]|nr:hypothetical protein PM082_021929 [Marasmius tenuissimus]
MPSFKYHVEEKGFDERSEFKKWLEGLTVLAEKYPKWLSVHRDQWTKKDEAHFYLACPAAAVANPTPPPPPPPQLSASNSNSSHSRSTPGARAPN